MYVSALAFDALRRAPVAWGSALGERLGRGFAERQMPVRAQRARDSLAALLPGLDGRDREAILSRRWGNMGRFFFELPSIPRLLRGDHIRIEREAALRAALATERPILFLSLHVGNWELLGAWLFAASGRTGFGVFDPPADPRQRALLTRVRDSYAPAMLPPGAGAAQRMAAHLADVPRAGVYLLLDERRERQVTFPSFGRAGVRSGNLAAALRIARDTRALVMPVHLERVAGVRFRLCWDTPVDVAATGMREAAAMLDARFGEVARALVDQWLALQDVTLRAGEVRIPPT